MKTPVCEEDVKNGQLCEECRQKVKQGKIGNLDFDVARILYRINEKRNLTAASFTRCVDLGKLIVIFTEGEPGVLIGRGGYVVSELSHALGKRVRVAQTSSDVRKTVSDLLSPAQMLGMNTVYKNGAQSTRVRIAKASLASLPCDVDTLLRAMKESTGMEMEIVIE